MFGYCAGEGKKRGAPNRWGAAVRFMRTSIVLSFITVTLMSCDLIVAHPPAVGLEIPRAYRAAAVGKNGALAAPDWWKSFHSAELTSLVEHAISVNYNIAAAVARIKQADAQFHSTGTLLLPSGGASFSHTATRNSAIVDGYTAYFEHEPEVHVWSFTGNVSYEADFWGKNAALVLAAKKTAAASVYDRDVVKLTVISSVINTYFQIMAYQDELRIARDNVRVAERNQGMIKQRVDAGTSTALDLVQQQYVVAQQRISIPQLREAIQQNVAAMATLLGEAPENVEIRGRSLRGIAVPTVSPGLPSELILQRPDIREAEAKLEAAASNVMAARKALLPSTQITGQYGYESLALKTLISPQAAVYQLAEGMTQPIFDLPKLIAQVQGQEGAQLEMLQNYRQAIISGFSDVERALIAVRETSIQERLTRRSVEIADEGYRLLNRQLAAGNVDITTLLNTQRTQFEAQNALVNAQLARFQAASALYQALGGGWTFDPKPAEASQQVPASPAPTAVPVVVH